MVDLMLLILQLVLPSPLTPLIPFSTVFPPVRFSEEGSSRRPSYFYTHRSLPSRVIYPWFAVHSFYPFLLCLLCCCFGYQVL